MMEILEAFEGVENIAGYKVVVMDELREKYPEKFIESGQMNWKWFEKDIRPNHFIYIRKDKNSLSFTMQSGDEGVNGCGVEALIEAAKLMVVEQPRARENSIALTKLDEAILWLEAKKNRESKGL